jgi:sugar O-acyltransferase (sialic acid O-acetyltransferase NeuD family)
VPGGMKQLLIFPYSATALEALDCLGNEWTCVGFISDDDTQIGKHFHNYPVFDRRALIDYPDAKVITVHGSPSSYRNRQAILDSLLLDEDRLATIIHPGAIISSFASIGRNVLIMAGVVITANAVIKDHVIILPNTVIHHDSEIGEFTLIAANVTIAGNVTIGSNCYLGAACSIKNGIKIGSNSLVGIGSNVISSFPNNVRLIGNPARPL